MNLSQRKDFQGEGKHAVNSARFRLDLDARSGMRRPLETLITTHSCSCTQSQVIGIATSWKWQLRGYVATTNRRAPMNSSWVRRAP